MKEYLVQVGNAVRVLRRMLERNIARVARLVMSTGERDWKFVIRLSSWVNSTEVSWK